MIPQCRPQLLSLCSSWSCRQRIDSCFGCLVRSSAVQKDQELTVTDTFHHMSNVGSLLLRIASECMHTDPALSAKAASLVITFCSTLARYWLDEQWDMADETLKRLAEPAFTVGKHCVQAREAYMIISNALGHQVPGEAQQCSLRYSRSHGRNRLGRPDGHQSFWFHQRRL